MHERHTVICTAGHIDHGKSSLIENLTGFHPDVLEEERQREMTIDLGFAFYGENVTFIDVPGHEKFLKTMLAGVSSVDGAILVIAADDGVMPQTLEHFEVLELLGIERGIIALTKTDKAESDWTDLVEEEIREMTVDSFLEDAPIIRVSNNTKTGMDNFETHLKAMIAKATARSDRGLFRMWIDRAFSLKGAGTIVAGTVLAGTVKAGDRVEILPEGFEARVKRIQVHKEDVSTGKIGERTALNLPGIDKNKVRRGQLLASPDHYRPTYMLNGRLNFLSSQKKPLENRTRLRLHLGSSEHICRVVMLEKLPIQPGFSALVQFRLEDQAMADIGDRFVIRSFSEGRVMGGGTLLEIHPQKMKYASEKEMERLTRLETIDPIEIVRQHLVKCSVNCDNAADISKTLAFTLDETIDIIGALHRDGEIEILQPTPKYTIVLKSVFVELKERVFGRIKVFHEKQPHLKGIRRADLKAKIMPDAPQLLTDSVINSLRLDETVEYEAEIVWIKGHEISFNEEQDELKERIASIYKAEKFVTPELGELSAKLDKKAEEIEPILTGLCELGILVRLYSTDVKPLYFHRDSIEEARRILIDFFKDRGTLRLSEFRELIGSTRKFTTPILMHFDETRLTFREGDVRKLI